MSSRNAVVRDGEVVNVVELDSGTAWTPPPRCDVIELPDGFAVGPGWSYADGQFIAPASEPPTWDVIRAERDRLLTACDWTMVSDTPLSDAESKAWSDYRQALRDIPQTFNDPNNVVWPKAP